MKSAIVQYPGEDASAAQLLALAEQYRVAAHLLLKQQSRPKEPLSRAPFHLTAIHAIELYLNALLMHVGMKAAAIRGMQHNLSLRTKAAVTKGLVLRKRTATHLETISGNREYLASRYGAEMTSSPSQINRLTATLDEVAAKVTKIVSGTLQG